MFVFACGGCGRQYSVEPHLAGRTARCRSCGAAMNIPSQEPAAAPAAQNPLGLNMDWDSMGLPPMSPAGPVLGGGYPLRNRSAKRRKSGNGVLWLALGGAGVMAALFVVAVVAAISQLNWGDSARAEAAAYLPADWTTAISLEPSRLVDQISRFPKAKPYVDQALAEAAAERVDVRSISEMLIVTKGRNKYMAAIFSRPMGPEEIFRGATSTETYQGRAIYAVPRAGRVEAMYAVAPHPRLIVTTNDLGRLKAALDQVANRLPGAVDLPTGRHFVMRIRDFSALRAMPMPTPWPADDIRGATISAQLSGDLSFSVLIDAKDSETAASYEKMATGGLEAIRNQQRRLAQNPAFKAASSLPDNLRIYASGSQLRITGSLPAAQLFDNLPPPSAFQTMPAFRPGLAPGTSAPQGQTGVAQ